MAWSTMRDIDTGELVTEADMDAIRGNIEYLLDPPVERHLAASTPGTTSTSWVDADATNLKATLTTSGGPVLVIVSGSTSQTGAASSNFFDVAVDGTRVSGHTDGLTQKYSTGICNMSFEVLVTGLAAGSHTFKLQWRVSGGTGYLQRASFTAIEL